MDLSYCCIPIKSKKWYHCLIWHSLDIAVVQGCILQKRNPGHTKLNLKAFRILVAIFIKQGKSTRVKTGGPYLSLEKAYESKKYKRTHCPFFQCFNLYGSLWPFSLFNQVSREGIENLIAKAIHLLSVQNAMLGYASPLVSKNSMIHKHLFHIYHWIY